MRSRVLTLVFTDLVGSVALKSKLGDAEAAKLISRHSDLVRMHAAEYGGREIVATGDGFFITFDAPSAAVEFALAVQSSHFAADQLNVRIGIHLGEVTESIAPAGSGGQVAVEGFAVDLASRIQSLALPGQVLLSYPAFDNARQRLGTHNNGKPILWRAHGNYLFKGHDEPMPIFEAGLEGISPLVPPVETEKARRAVSDEDESTLGWRPAQGQELPGRPNWILIQKLGEGGFGEAWVASQKKTGEKRVFKFCYALQPLRAMKREVTLFRLLKEALGDRDDIARIMDWQFDAPPYYLEMEYSGGKSLTDWAKEQGNLNDVPLPTRIEIVAQIAEAIAAAHSVGILHKDIKPSNVLIVKDSAGQPKIRMIDFGIGLITDEQLLANRGITALGMSQGLPLADDFSGSGTRLYMAPELLEGKPVTTLSDVYSLGVLLYQIVSGDFTRALAAGWERDISDDLLREDILACVEGVPEHRLASASELAWRLRNLSERHARREAEARQIADAALARSQAQRAQQRAKILAVGILVGAVVLGLVSMMAVREAKRSRENQALLRRENAAKLEAMRLRNEAQDAQLLANREKEKAEREQYFAAIGFADAHLKDGRIEPALDLLVSKTPERLRGWEWGRLMAAANPDLMTLCRYTLPFGVMHADYSPDGKRIVTGDRRDNKGSVILWDGETGRKLASAEPHDAGIWTAKFSPDGSRIITSSWDTTAAILDARSLARLATLRGHTHRVRGAAFSPDGKRVATAGHDRTIRIWDATTGNQQLVIQNATGPVYDVAFSPDGKRLASASLDRMARLWDSENGHLIREFPGHTGNVLSVAFSPDGRLLLTASADMRARLFDVETAALFRQFDNAKAYMHCAAISHNGSLVATSDEEGTCRVWDVQTSAMLHQVQGDTQMYKVQFSPDDRRLLTTSGKSVKLWSLDSIADGVLDTTITTGTISDSDQVISLPAERKNAWKDYDRLWNVPGGRTLMASANRLLEIHSFYSSFSPDRTTRIVINETTAKASARDTATNRQIAVLAEGKSVYSARFSPDGRWAAVGSYSNTVYLYDTDSWALANTFTGGSSQHAVSCVRFSPDSSTLLAAFFDGTCRLWDIESGSLRQDLQPHIRVIYDAAFSPDGQRFATCSTDFLAKVWNTQTGDQVSTMSGHSMYVFGVDFNPEGTRLLTFANDGTAKLWETETGREIMTLLRQPSENVTLLSARFTKDGIAAYVTDSRRVLTYLETFPWRKRFFPGDDAIGIARRMELWKRQTRLAPEIEAGDIGW